MNSQFAISVVCNWIAPVLSCSPGLRDVDLDNRLQDHKCHHDTDQRHAEKLCTFSVTRGRCVE